MQRLLNQVPINNIIIHTRSSDALDQLICIFIDAIEALKLEHAKLLTIQENPRVLVNPNSPWQSQSIVNRLTALDCLPECLDDTQQLIICAEKVCITTEAKMPTISNAVDNITADQTTGADDDNNI